MTNHDIDRYNLKPEEKHELRMLRNRRRRMKKRGWRSIAIPKDKGGGRTTLREVNTRITELQKNGAR